MFVQHLANCLPYNKGSINDACYYITLWSLPHSKHSIDNAYYSCGVEMFLSRLFVSHYFKCLKGIYYLKENFCYKGKECNLSLYSSDLVLHTGLIKQEHL